MSALSCLAPRLFPFLGALCLLAAGCDKSPFDQTGRALDQAEERVAAKDYRGAVSCYERALDGSPKSADAHFRLAIIYDEQLNDPVSAVHHFRRYLDLAPQGAHRQEAQTSLARLEYTLATTLSGGTLISRAEALKLRTENNDLRKQLAASKAQAAAASAASPSPAPGVEAGKAAEREARRKPAPGTRTYTVQPGDTFSSIARKFYKNRARARDIEDANRNSVPNPKKLKPGQVLIIP
jgi:tetratricopeptide (TPR) repeat protein